MQLLMLMVHHLLIYIRLCKIDALKLVKRRRVTEKVRPILEVDVT